MPPQLDQLFDQTRGDEVMYEDYFNPISGQESRVMMTELEQSGWKLGVTILKQDFRPPFHSIKKWKMGMQALIITLGVCLLIWLSTFVRGNHLNYWWYAAAMGLLFALNIGYIWALILDRPIELNQKKEQIITEPALLQRFVQQYDSLAYKMHEEKALKIETGIFIEHLEFANASTISVSGYVWQKYKPELLKEGFQPGLHFAETAPAAEGVELAPAYIRHVDGKTVEGMVFPHGPAECF